MKKIKIWIGYSNPNRSYSRCCCWGNLFFGNPGVETYLKPIGDFFLRLIKMIVIPIVVSSLILGVAGAGDGKK
ncbi:hypothetical protein BsIDN1_18950 [Bacillus safensis]|uniref:Uncharacterized protein n=1 Tax=Bacillus safensis TaxID=561879 RepID=A0A5S9M450_BACIA|nr:hypothetical protein BsIDN1_18950 [Bacillus safensis]